MKRFGEKERDRRKELETEVWHRGNNKAGGMGGRRRKGRETPAKYDSYYKFTPHSRSQMQVYTFQESDSSIHTFFCSHEISELRVLRFWKVTMLFSEE